MSDEADRIEREIQQQRGHLGDHIDELQDKLKGVVDWRVQFEQRPMTMLGLAFGGGVLLSALLPGPRRSSSRRSRRDDFDARDARDFDSAEYGSARDRSPNGSAVINENGSASRDDLAVGPQTHSQPPRQSKIRSHASDTVGNVGSALLGVAAARLSDYLEDIVPGFRQEYRKAESGNT